MSEIMKTYRGGKTVGKPRSYPDRHEMDIDCSFVGKLVTIVISKRGLVVCRNWKKCEHHGKELQVPETSTLEAGVVICPEKYFRGRARAFLARRGKARESPNIQTSNEEKDK